MSKKKSQQNHKNQISSEFKKNIKETYKNVLDLSNAPEELRLSDKIIDLIEPFLESFDLDILTDCATIAWNECVYEDFQYKSSYVLKNALLNFKCHSDLIEALKRRKRQLFADNERHIQQIRAYQKGEDISVNVAATVDVEEAFKRLVGMMQELAEETQSD